ncbi:hypothetical protein EYF80_028232 [Liparis tanakae]|uniref:Uncharacterized protein n=1 Tax=Liparis tanakae TaxID=230148 RepID=A0A4Z2H6F8_9TELE|nr:hypothetical protein EYF80_028232 [Liparis tanakae]
MWVTEDQSGPIRTNSDADQFFCLFFICLSNTFTAPPDADSPLRGSPLGAARGLQRGDGAQLAAGQEPAARRSLRHTPLLIGRCSDVQISVVN